MPLIPPTSRRFRGNALGNLRRLEEALASYDKALAINPAYAEVLNNRGNALIGVKRPDEALARYDKALAINPPMARRSTIAALRS